MKPFRNKHAPQTVATTNRRLGVIMGLWVALLVSPLVAQEAAQEAAQPLPPGRFLFLVDTSLSMRGRAAGTVQTLESLLASDLDGRLRPGDTLGLWTFNESVYAGRFPLQTWSPAQRTNVTTNVVEFVRQQRYAKKTDLDKVLALALPLVRESPAITLILFTDGDEPLRGTPFDDAINTVFREHRREQSRARTPFVTVLRAEGGRLVNHVVGQPQWHFNIPLLPSEQAAMEAARQSAKSPETELRGALEAAQAGKTLPITKPKPAETVASKPAQTEPAAKPDELPKPVPAPPKHAPVPAVVTTEATKTGTPSVPPTAPAPPAPAVVSTADSSASEPGVVIIETRRPDTASVAPSPVETESSPALALPVRQPDAPTAPPGLPPAASKPAALLSPQTGPKPEALPPVKPPPPVVETAPAFVVSAVPPEPVKATTPTPVEARSPVIEQPPVEPAAPVAVESPATPVSVEQPPVQTAVAIPPQPFPGGMTLLVLGLLLLGVAGVLFILIMRRSRGRTAAGSLITQSFDRDRDPP